MFVCLVSCLFVLSAKCIILLVTPMIVGVLLRLDLYEWFVLLLWIDTMVTAEELGLCMHMRVDGRLRCRIYR